MIKSIWQQISKQIVTNRKELQGRVLKHSPAAAQNSPDSRIHPRFLPIARKYEGKLLLRSEIDIDSSIFEMLLEKSFFTATPSIQKNFLFPICTRCNNTKKSLFASFSCKRCQLTHLYCRKCLSMARVLECESLYYWTGSFYHWPAHKDPCSWTGTLTFSQEKAAKQITYTVREGGELLIWAVTGAGKTEMLFPGITNALQLGKRVCIATPRADVVRELLPRLQQAFKFLHIQGLYSGSRDNDGSAQLLIATTHQLLRYKHAFDLLIIDEIDAFPFHHDASLQFAAERAAKLDASLIYLTATPREEQQAKMNAGKLPHVFVPRRFHGEPLPVPRMIHNPSINKNYISPSFVSWFKNRKVPDRQLLLFVPTITLANEWIHPLKEWGLKNKLISHPSEISEVHAEDKEREQKINRFRNKEIYMLITTTILERGVTFPSVDVLVLDADHQVFDEAALIQIAGRAGRSPVDPTGEVIFFYEGKTNAMVRAKKSIEKMNQRASRLKREE